MMVLPQVRAVCIETLPADDLGGKDKLFGDRLIAEMEVRIELASGIVDIRETLVSGYLPVEITPDIGETDAGRNGKSVLGVAVRRHEVHPVGEKLDRSVIEDGMLPLGDELQGMPFSQAVAEPYIHSQVILLVFGRCPGRFLHGHHLVGQSVPSEGGVIAQIPLPCRTDPQKGRTAISVVSAEEPFLGPDEVEPSVKRYDRGGAVETERGPDTVRQVRAVVRIT